MATLCKQEEELETKVELSNIRLHQSIDKNRLLAFGGKPTGNSRLTFKCLEMRMSKKKNFTFFKRLQLHGIQKYQVTSLPPPSGGCRRQERPSRNAPVLPD